MRLQEDPPHFLKGQFTHFTHEVMSRGVLRSLSNKEAFKMNNTKTKTLIVSSGLSRHGLEMYNF